MCIKLVICKEGKKSQTVQRLATGWTVRGSNPSEGARYSAPVQTGPEAHPVSYTMGKGSLLGGKERLRRAAVAHVLQGVAEDGRLLIRVCASEMTLRFQRNWKRGVYRRKLQFTAAKQHTECSNRAFVLLKMGIMMPETC